VTKIYWIIGPLILCGYLFAEARGIVVSGTDRPAGAYANTTGGRRSPRGGGGFFFFGTGYRGGK